MYRYFICWLQNREEVNLNSHLCPKQQLWRSVPEGHHDRGVRLQGGSVLPGQSKVTNLQTNAMIKSFQMTSRQYRPFRIKRKCVSYVGEHQLATFQRFPVNKRNHHSPPWEYPYGSVTDWMSLNLDGESSCRGDVGHLEVVESSASLLPLKKREYLHSCCGEKLPTSAINHEFLRNQFLTNMDFITFHFTW